MEKKGKTKFLMGGLACGILLMLLTGAVFAVKYLLKDDRQRRQRRIQMVTVVKPPPPPKVKEKPPEPEIEKKEEIVETEPEKTPPEPVNEMSEDDTPPGDELGLDAEGSGGADGFGLRAKKGGRALIGGTFSDASLMRRYAWYTRIIQEELSKRMKRLMEEEGGIPDGNLKALIRITLDDMGKIIDFELAGSSGNRKMDDAVIKALRLSTISEPPPDGMPRVIKLKISARG